MSIGFRQSAVIVDQLISRMWSWVTRPPTSAAPPGAGRAWMREPLPWCTVRALPVWWARSMQAEPQASSS